MSELLLLLFFAGSIAIRFGDIGQGEGIVLKSRVACNGSESSLSSCPSSEIGDHFCSHRTDAGAICVGEFYIYI